MTSLFVPGIYTGTSNVIMNGKIECDALDETSIQTCAEWIAMAGGPFGSVEGVPPKKGGIDNGGRLAEALQSYVSEGPLLIVDDVYTTGGSMEKCKNGRDAKGFVIFARGPLPGWINALYQAHPVIWWDAR